METPSLSLSLLTLVLYGMAVSSLGCAAADDAYGLHLHPWHIKISPSMWFVCKLVILYFWKEGRFGPKYMWVRPDVPCVGGGDMFTYL